LTRHERPSNAGLVYSWHNCKNWETIRSKQSIKKKLQSPKKNVEPEIAALHEGAVDHLGVLVAPSRVLLHLPD
jgi:hypothetical protein